ncbi:hypothetical protein E2C01_055064 [Portunus trituberculatus]|uniref:Uncharacterized protein n=1 Tax=Portunus trituberculatus TaxID=210409 RepID=A0A5B7GQ77_PORTR|nr:hypothetical protein [Portunus trituberculatus]
MEGSDCRIKTSKCPVSLNIFILLHSFPGLIPAFICKLFLTHAALQ